MAKMKPVEGKLKPLPDEGWVDDPAEVASVEITNDGWFVKMSDGNTVILPTWRAGSPHAAGLLVLSELAEAARKKG